MFRPGSSIVPIGGVRSTSHVQEAGDGSVLPARSIARTSKVWEPSESASRTWVLVQAEKSPPSTLHSNAELVSVEAKSKLGVGAFDGSPGRVPIEVSGGVRSTVTSATALAVRPALSVARARSARAPSAGRGHGTP